MGDIYVYSAQEEANDYATMGLVGALTPTSSRFRDAANGESIVEITHPLDEYGRYLALVSNNIILAPVPVMTPPEITADNKCVTTIWRYKVKGKGQLSGDPQRYLYKDKKGTGRKAILEYGQEVIVVAERDKPAPARWKVRIPKGTILNKKALKKDLSGWINPDGFDYVDTKIIPDNSQAIQEVASPWSVAMQYFRIYEEKKTDTEITVSARHIRYDLLYNATKYKSDTAVDLPTALGAYANDDGPVGTPSGIFGLCYAPHKFQAHTNIVNERAGLYYERKNILHALIDPDEGICKKYNVALISDNYDLYFLNDPGLNRGVRIQYRKNMLGVECVISTDTIATRIVPVGEQKNGDPLLLSTKDSKGNLYPGGQADDYIDSPHINDYPVIKVYELECTNCKIGQKEKGGGTLSGGEAIARMKQQVADLYKAECDRPTVTMKVEFLNLGDSEEYSEFRGLEDCFLWDYIIVQHPDLNIDVTSRIVEIEWDIALERMISCTIGEIGANQTNTGITSWQIPTFPGSKIANGTVDSAALAGDIISTRHLQADSINANAIQAGSITSEKIVAGSVTADKLDAVTVNARIANISEAVIEQATIKGAQIEDASITTAKIGTAQIITALIADASITSAKIGALAVGTANIQNAAIDTAKIKDLSVSTAKIADASIVSVKIADASITNAKIGALAVGTANIQTAAITTALIGDSAITNTKIGTAAVDSAQIKDLAVTGAKIADASITSAKIGIAQIGTAQIADASITNAKIGALAVGTANIQNAAIDTAQIKDASITTAKIGNVAIGTAQIADASITNAKIANLAVGTTKIADASITNAKIGALAVGTANIQTASITTALIGVGAVNTAQIADASITSAKIVELTANKITSGTLSTDRLIITGSDKSIVFEINESNGTSQLSQTTIDGGSLTKRTVTADVIVAGAITANELAASSVTANQIAANAVTAGKIAANAVTAGTIAAGAVTAGKIAAGAVTAGTIAAGSITATELAANAVTAGKIAANAVTATELAANAVTAGKIATNAVTAGTIAAGAVTTGALAAGSVTASQIAASTITATQLASGAVTTDKLAVGSVIADRIASNAVTSDKILAGSVTAGKIAALSITANEIAAGTITAAKIAAGTVTTDRLASNVGSTLDISSNTSILSRVSNTTYNSEKPVVSNTAPGSPAVGKLWVDTSLIPPQQKEWNGSSWIIVNDVVIGGTNLVYASREFKFDESRLSGWWSPNGFTFSRDSENFVVASKSATGNTSNMYYGVYTSLVPCKKGDTFTVQTMFKVDNLAAWNDMPYIYVFEIYDANGVRIEWTDIYATSDLSNKPILKNGEWTKVYSTHTVSNANAAKCGVRLSLFKNGSVSFKQVKIEEGNRATAWSPAPEDQVSMLGGSNYVSIRDTSAFAGSVTDNQSLGQYYVKSPIQFDLTGYIDGVSQGIAGGDCYLNYALIPGKTYTVSFWYWWYMSGSTARAGAISWNLLLAAESVPFYDLYDYTLVSDVSGMQNPSYGTPKKMSYTFTMPTTVTGTYSGWKLRFILHGNNNANRHFFITDPMLEEGNKASEWSISPLDQKYQTTMFSSAIEQTDRKIELKTTQNELEQYLRFQNGIVEVGANNSLVRTQISNSEFAVVQNNLKVAYMSNTTLGITNARIDQQLRIGNFMLAPAPDGGIIITKG